MSSSELEESSMISTGRRIFVKGVFFKEDLVYVSEYFSNDELTHFGDLNWLPPLLVNARNGDLFQR
jgi:hypothetical protein